MDFTNRVALIGGILTFLELIVDETGSNTVTVVNHVLSWFKGPI
jgi:hypothetical protein